MSTTTATSSLCFQPMKTPWKITEFDGNHVSAYLRKYNLLATDCGLSGEEKLYRFPLYCSNEVIPIIEALNGYSIPNWDTFQKSLKHYYFDQDPQQYEYQIPFLRSLAEQQRQKQRTTATDLKTYSTHFRRIAKQLLKEGKITQYSACAEYVSGLPEEVQEDLQRSLNVRWTEVGSLNVETIINQVITLEDQRNERARMIGSTTSYTTDSTVDSEPSISFPPPTNACVTISDPLPEDKLMVLMDKMIEMNTMVDAMASAIRTGHPYGHPHIYEEY